MKQKSEVTADAGNNKQLQQPGSCWELEQTRKSVVSTRPHNSKQLTTILGMDRLWTTSPARCFCGVQEHGHLGGR